MCIYSVFIGAEPCFLSAYQQPPCTPPTNLPDSALGFQDTTGPGWVKVELSSAICLAVSVIGLVCCRAKTYREYRSQIVHGFYDRPCVHILRLQLCDLRFLVILSLVRSYFIRHWAITLISFHQHWEMRCMFKLRRFVSGLGRRFQHRKILASVRWLLPGWRSCAQHSSVSSKTSYYGLLDLQAMWIFSTSFKADIIIQLTDNIIFLFQTNGTHATYSNVLFIYPINSAPFAVPSSLPFTCTYSLDTETTLNVAIRPFLS